MHCYAVLPLSSVSTAMNKNLGNHHRASALHRVMIIVIVRGLGGMRAVDRPLIYYCIFRFDVFHLNINLVFSAYPHYSVAYWEPTPTYRMQYGDSLAHFVTYSALANVAAG